MRENSPSIILTMTLIGLQNLLENEFRVGMRAQEGSFQHIQIHCLVFHILRLEAQTKIDDDLWSQ